MPHLQDVDLRADVRMRVPGLVRGSTRRGRREPQRRFRVVVVGEVGSLSDVPNGGDPAAEGDVFLFRYDGDREQLLLVDGTTRLAGPNL